MSNAAIIQASYSDLRLVKGRKMLQLVFEIPIEYSDKALAVLGGMPDPSTSRWFAIARLNDPVGNRPEKPKALINGESDSDGDAELLSGRSSQAVPKGAGRGQKRSWDELSPAQQAGMLCNDPVFWRYLTEYYATQPVHNADDAAVVVRIACDVDLRADITANNPHWLDMTSDFRAWKIKDQVVPV